MVRGLATAAQNCGQVRVKVLKKIVEIGISTTIPRYASVKPRLKPNPGSTLFRFVFAFTAIARRPAPTPLTSRLINLVEYAAVAEKLGLRLFPSAKIRIDREQAHAWKLARILRGDGLVARTEKILRDYFLPLGSVQKFQIRLRDRGRAVNPVHLVHPRDRRFGQDAYRRIHDLEFVGAKLLD